MDGRTHIVERKVRLDGTTEEFLCERLLVEPGKRAVLRYVLERGWSVAGVLAVPRGAVTISHYWVDRPYNVYHWIVAGSTLAYYCNVSEPPTIGEDLVEYADLAVDVLITPAGEATVLDEDELPTDLSPARRIVVARALEALTSAPLRIAREIEAESRRFA